MATDPVQQAWARRRANRRRADGWTPFLRSALGAAAVIALLVPLMQRVFLTWVDGPADYAPVAMEALLLRANIVVIGWLAIDVYTALIRRGDREVLALWPVDPAMVVRFELWRLARNRLVLILGWAVLSAPIATVWPLLWVLGVIQVAFTWVLALTASGVVTLFAVQIAEDERFAPFLDLVRGNNHRAQAAFLYAPGFTLLAIGVLVSASGAGVRWLALGDPLGAGLLVAPLLVGLVLAVPIPGLARKRWFQAGQLMAEVDARYAVLEDREEALRVYLDWMIRFLPADMARYALNDLRHGWRARRTPIMGAWLVGLAALVATWTDDPSGPVRAASIAVIGCWVVASLGVMMERDEPEFLRAWLPDGGVSKWGGRVVVLLLWQQPAVWLGAFAAMFRQGWGSGLFVAGVVELSVVLAAVMGTVCGRSGGLPVYGPVAAGCTAVVVLLVQTGVS